MARKFDFASPGIQLNEIDKSQIPAETTEDGILLIGTSLKGPAMKPVKVKDLDSFIEIFGAPQAGKPGTKVDVWRDGNRHGPTYAAYAAQAHLASKTSPVTFIRLLGEQSSASEVTDTKAGWNLGGLVNTPATANQNTHAYGLFIMPSASAAAGATGSLAAVIYTTGSAATLRGIPAGGSVVTSSTAQLIESQANGRPSTFKLDIWSSNSAYDTYTFHFGPDQKQGFIRDVLNTNPQKINSTNFATTESYFVGETFEQAVKELVNDVAPTAGKQYGILMPLVSGSTSYLSNIKEAAAAKSGWIISRNDNPSSAPSTWSAQDATKLFRVVSLHEGEWVQENYGIKIHDLNLGTVSKPDSSFSLSVINAAGNAIETFSNLNLNEASANFILKKIGDEDRVWDTTNKVFNITGDYPNRSNYIRIEMSDAWKAGLSDSYALPFGFYGPSKIKGFTLAHGSSGVHTFGDTDNDLGVRATNTITYAGAMLTGDDLVMTHPDLGAFTISFEASGTSDTEFTSQVASIYVDVADDAAKTGIAVRTLLNTIPGYSATDDGAGVVTVLADTAGPHMNVALTENTDSGTSQAFGAGTAGVDGDDANLHAWVKGNNYNYGTAGDADLFASMPVAMTASFLFPDLRLTEQGSKMNGNYNNTDVHGLRHVWGSSNSSNKTAWSSGDYSDFANGLPAGLDAHSTANSTEVSQIFTLDEMIEDSSGLWYWDSGSLAATTSYTYTNNTKGLLDKGVKQFNVPLFGGCDGLDITQVDPFSSAAVLDGKTVKSHYAYYTMDKAIEIAADPESVRYDVVSIPGMTNSGLQNKMIRKVEERGDAMVVIDMDDSFLDTFENSGIRSGGEVDSILSHASSRDLNTSYAATYAPRLKLRDTLSGNDEILIVPPSVGAIGAMAFSEANSDGPWFAPAGFNRGGLSVLGGNSGPRVIGTLKTLSKKQRDELYQVNVNPIARFPAVGEIVIFGQKTLQQTPSALDRINVRRLMIYLKKKVGLIADTILFEQNIQATWNRFLSQADPLLSSVKTRFGISDYKLVLDTSTTTDDLIDRNILYAKVFVKPARAIEYIVIDFIVTRTGVEF